MRWRDASVRAASVPRASVRHRLLHVWYGLSVVAAAVACLAGTVLTVSVVVLVVALIPMVAMPVGSRRNRVLDRRPWIVGMVGLTLLNVTNVLGVVRVGFGKVDWYPAEYVFVAVGYLTLLSASVLVALRHARGNDAVLIHAALVGVSFAGPLWEFILRPRLLNMGAPTPVQIITLIDGLVLLTAMGPLLRASRTAPRARAALVYLALSLVFALAGIVVSILAPADMSDRWSSPFWCAGYLSLAAAALHPSSARLTYPEKASRPGRSSIQLRYLGAILAINPVVGALPQLWGMPPDGLLLSMGTLLMIVLVLARIAQLLREREEAHAALNHQASHDELTGLSNRREVLSRLEDALAEWTAGRVGDVAVLYCDLDGFKPVNDRLGHRAGDDVLRTVAQRLRDAVRSRDSVGRLGGDEFLIVCPGLDQRGAAMLQRRIQESVSAPMRVGEAADVQIGVTVGMAVAAPGDCADSDGLVAAADHEMYTGKRSRQLAQLR